MARQQYLVGLDRGALPALWTDHPQFHGRAQPDGARGAPFNVLLVYPLTYGNLGSALASIFLNYETLLAGLGFTTKRRSFLGTTISPHISGVLWPSQSTFTARRGPDDIICRRLQSHGPMLKRALPPLITDARKCRFLNDQVLYSPQNR